MLGYLKAASISGGQKQKGESTTGGWYKFYGKMFVYQTGTHASRVVLQLHLTLNLVHHTPVRQDMQVPKLRPTVQGAVLLAAV